MIQIFKKDIYYLVFGLISLALGLFIGLFNSELPIFNFLSGLFTGLSIPLNLFGIYKIARQKREQKF
jgi:hypothetical protein